jgi:hypothetical protein
MFEFFGIQVENIQRYIIIVSKYLLVQKPQNIFELEYVG